MSLPRDHRLAKAVRDFANAVTEHLRDTTVEGVNIIGKPGCIENAAMEDAWKILNGNEAEYDYLVLAARMMRLWNTIGSVYDMQDAGRFYNAIGTRLRLKEEEGYEGWDGAYPEECLREELANDVCCVFDGSAEQHHYLDVAARAMFLWYRRRNTIEAADAFATACG